MTRGTPLIHGKTDGGSLIQRWGLTIVSLAVVLVVTSCATSGEQGEATSTVAGTATVPTGCADVVAASIESSGETYRVSATILSADTGWDKYADAWDVRSPDGTVLGTRLLAHPHVDEQPFTRSLSDVDIPTNITEVEIAARDLVAGFCGETVTITVPGR